MRDLTTLLQRIWPRKPAKPSLTPIRALLAQGKFDILFQPVIALHSGSVDGYEALVRGQKDSELFAPKALLKAARAEELQTELELACVDATLQAWSAQPQAVGRVYLNLTAATMVALSEPEVLKQFQDLLIKHRVPYQRVVVELSQHRKLEDVHSLERTTIALQSLGCAIALDDVKASQRSLALWQRLKPAIVKLDSRMSTDVKQDPTKAQVLRTLAALAFKMGTALVAKSVEGADDLRAVRDAGIPYAQGYFLGFPSPSVVDTLNLRARQVLAESWDQHSVLETQAGDLAELDYQLQGLSRGQQWFD